MTIRQPCPPGACVCDREQLLQAPGADLRILNLACQRLWGLTLPQRGIEVSSLYHDSLYRRYPDAAIDLHLAAICQHLALPPLPVHDALSDAITAALIYLRLTQGGPLAYPKV